MSAITVSEISTPRLQLAGPFDDAFLATYLPRRVAGRGGRSLIVLAVHLPTGRKVAVKILQEIRSDEDVARFLREGRLVARLRHPGLLPVYDLGVVCGRPYLAMELATGGSLRERLQDGAVRTPRQVSDELSTCLDALAECHEQGIVHRDVKPENILFDAQGHSRLADFGIALPDAGAFRLTPTGIVVGTPRYASPEMIRGEVAAPAADVYAMGIVLFEMLAGRAPPASLLERRPDLPPRVAEDVERCMATDPEQRFQSARELATAVALWPRHARRHASGRLGRTSPPRAGSSTNGGSSVRRRLAMWCAAAAAIVLTALCLPVRRAPGAPDPPDREARPAEELRRTLDCSRLVREDGYRRWTDLLVTISIGGRKGRADAAPLAIEQQRALADVEQALATVRARHTVPYRAPLEVRALWTRALAAGAIHRFLATEAAAPHPHASELLLVTEPPAVDPAGERRALAWLGEYASMAPDTIAGVACAGDGAELAAQLDDVRGVARTVAFTRWSAGARGRVRTLAADLSQRLARRGEDLSPLAEATARATTACWTWGYAGPGRGAGGAASRALLDLADSVRRDGGSLLALAERAARESCSSPAR